MIKQATETTRFKNLGEALKVLKEGGYREFSIFHLKCDQIGDSEMQIQTWKSTFLIGEILDAARALDEEIDDEEMIAEIKDDGVWLSLARVFDECGIKNEVCLVTR